MNVGNIPWHLSFCEIVFTLWQSNIECWLLLTHTFNLTNKQPGISPVRVGGSWRRLMAKCLILVAGPEAKAACRTTQLAGGVEAGIEGAIHAMRVLWEEHAQEEDWGFILIDTHNAFNEENRIAMLWAVWHECPSGAQFTFNWYRHWATLVVRDKGYGSGHFLHSKEGMTQGDPLTMISYGIRVLTLIRELQGSHPPCHIALISGQGGGWVKVHQHPRTSTGPAGSGTGPGLLPGANQKHFGRGPGECSLDRGAL